MELAIVWDGDRAPFAKAFVAAQKATEAVKKAATNPAFRSKYADLAGVVEAVVPALNANGIGVIQFPGFDGELVTVTTTLLHESGSSVTGTLALRPTKADPQGVGSAVTYGRRYSLLAVTGAAPEDDDGNAASEPQGRRSAANANPAQEVVREGLQASVDALKRSPNGRLIPAEAKRQNIHGQVNGKIDGCETLGALAALELTFDELTKDAPESWLVPFRDRIANRRKELVEPESPPDWEAREQALDDEFRDTVGSPRNGALSGRSTGQPVSV